MKTINDYKIIQTADGNWQIIGIIGLKEEYLFSIPVEQGVTIDKLRERVEIELKTRNFTIDENNMAVEFEEDMTTIRKLMRSALRTLDDDSMDIEQKNKRLPIIQNECLVSQTIMKTYSLEIQRKQVGIKTKATKGNA